MKSIFRILTLLILISILTVTSLAVVPTYNMSREYRAEKYFDNFSRVELSGDGANDVLAIALSQLGYHEGDSDADLGGLNENGERDFVEYNVLKGKLDNNQGNGISYGYYWCASFVNWCLRQARIPVKDAGAAEISCRRWLAAAKNEGIYHEKSGYTPKSADLIFFKDEGSEVTSTHMGIVLYSLPGYVYTIEGNTSNGSEFSKNGNYVAIKSYPLNSQYIVGYASPRYATNEAVADVDYSGKKLTAGLYIAESEIVGYTSESLQGLAQKIERYTTFEVVEISGNIYKIIYVSGGVENIIFADIRGKARQLQASEQMPSLSLLDDDGSLMYPKIQGEVGQKINLPEEKPVGDKRGFIGWSRVAGGRDNLLSPGSSVTLGEAGVKLYAIWDYNFYLISFKAPDGSIIAQRYGYFGDSFEVPSPENIPDGYIFAGWDSDGISTVITKDASYTAIFEKIVHTMPEDTESTEESRESGAQIEGQTELNKESDTPVQSNTQKPTDFGCKATLGSGELIFAIISCTAIILLKKRIK